jgi:hypothetical protein
MFMKKKQWYEAPEAEILDLRLEASIALSVTTGGSGSEDLDDPDPSGPTNPWG